MEYFNPGAPFHYTSAWNPTRVHPVSGLVRPHRGEDWAAPAGTPIPAAGAGKVVYKGVMNGYGNVVVLEHANGAEIVHTLYAHMRSASPLAMGAAVAKGGTVGPCGNTGIGTGAHLHFEVLRNGTKGHPNLAQGHATVNPRGFDISNLTHPDNATAAAPAATPATTPAAAASTQKMSFQYPIRKHGGSQFEDAEELYKALEGETAGHYLLGSNHFWHGGIHITNASAPQCIRDEPVRCMADGVVVAYRLNKNYLTSDFEPAKGLQYSTSFCLVRHEYESPANEKSEGVKTNKLVFFSLYMHVLPYELYTAEEEKAPRVATVVNGGWPARTHHKDDPQSKVVENIPSGVEFEVLKEQPTADGKYNFAQGKILKGKIGELKKDDVVWFAIEEDGQPIKNSKNKERLKTVLPPERKVPGYWKGMVEATITAPRGLKVRGAPSGDKAGEQVAPDQVLCTGSTIRFDSDKIKWLLVDGKKYPMAECTFVPSGGTGLKGEGVLPATFWCSVDDVGSGAVIKRKSTIPTVFDSVVVCNSAIKAGEPIGYLGLYETPADDKGNINKKHQVHIEIFSSDEKLEEYLKNPAALVEGKKYLKLKKGQVLAAKGGTDQAPVFTPQEPGLPADTLVPVDRPTIIKDSAGKEWVRAAFQSDGKPQTGFIEKEKQEIICQHDWEKLGFKVIKESNATADGFLDPGDMPAFFKELYAKIDAKGTQDNEVTSAELQSALRDPEIRSEWSKLIAYHPTEWQAKSSEPKWERLKTLMKDSPELLKHEQERIDKLVFWDEMAGAMQIPLPSQIYHFHPIEFIGNFKAKGPVAHAGLFTVADGKAAIKIIYEKYGKDMAVIIERMYRDETGHFESGQYANCGTGGMEAFGSPPYYGWDSSIFEANPEYTPTGTWSAFENKGMSGQGGNAQITDKKKVFVVLPSVIAGMEYKAAYIKRHNGQWARWHSTDTNVQAVYKKHIEAIRARFVEALEKGE